MRTDNRAVERFDHFWDAVADGSRAADHQRDVPFEWQDAVLRLHAADVTPHADPRFIRHLEDSFMARSHSAPHAGDVLGLPLRIEPARPGKIGSGATRPRGSRRLGPVLMSAALITMVIAIGVFLFGRENGPTNQFAAHSIALPPASPTAADCTTAPRTAAPAHVQTPLPPPIAISTVVANGLDGGPEFIVALSDLPTGNPASAKQINGITATLRQFVACGARTDDAGVNLPANWDAHARQFALFTDDYLQRHVAPTSETVGAGTPEPPWWAAYWSASAAWSAGSATPAKALALPDGRVSAWVDDGGDGVSLVVFVQHGDRWLIDERATLATPGSGVSIPAAGGAPQPPHISLILADILYTPNQLGIPPDADVALTLVNIGAVRHTFNIDALNIHVELAAGAQTTITVHASGGTYAFYCRVPGHRSAGMSGQLIADVRYSLPTPERGDAAATPRP